MLGNLISQDSSFSGGPATRADRHLQRFFLERLHRMVAVRQEQSPILEAGSQNLRLLAKCIYSTYCDCLDLGAGEGARAVLRQGESGAVGGSPPEEASN